MVALRDRTKDEDVDYTKDRLMGVYFSSSVLFRAKAEDLSERREEEVFNTVEHYLLVDEGQKD